MKRFDWIKQLLLTNQFEMPEEFRAILENASVKQGPFYFSDVDEGEEDTERMNRMFPKHDVAAFGRRLDYDGVVCLVVSDCDYPKGSVLVLHWDGWPGTEIDEEYPSLAAWAKSAEEEIAVRLDDE